MNTRLERTDPFATEDRQPGARVTGRFSFWPGASAVQGIRSWFTYHQPKIEVSILAIALFCLMAAIVPVGVFAIPGYIIGAPICFVAASLLIRWARARWVE